MIFRSKNDKIRIEFSGDRAPGYGFKGLVRLGRRSLADAHPCRVEVVRLSACPPPSFDSNGTGRKYTGHSRPRLLQPASDPLIQLRKPASPESVSAHFAEPLFVKDPPLA